jgi:hypothetical protein
VPPLRSGRYLGGHCLDPNHRRRHRLVALQAQEAFMLKVSSHGLLFSGSSRAFRELLLRLRSFGPRMTLLEFCRLHTR